MDFIAVSQVLVFPPGPPGSRQCVNVTIRDDQVLEDNETLLIELSSSDATVTTNLSLATIVITDDDSKYVAKGGSLLIV